MTNEVYEEIQYGDLFLKFPDEASASQALEGYAGSVDIIGEIEGVDGWHVNTRGEMPLELEAFSVNPEPTTPIRVWA